MEKYEKIANFDIIGYNKIKKKNPTNKKSGDSDFKPSGVIMSYSLETIIKSLHSRIQQSENGYIKLGFENGKLVAATQYNNPTEEEKKYPVVKQDFSLETELKEAMTGTFFGTLGLVFSGQKITNCYKSQSWKGTTLEGFIGG